jgi:O-antigen/teichoic acid export membrane protein
MEKAAKHSVILIGAYFATSFLNYGFGVALSWFFSPAQFGILGVAQSLLLLIALAVGSGFAWTAAHDVASSGINQETRRRFRASLAINTILGTFIAFGLWGVYRTGWLPFGPDYGLVIPLVGLTTIILSARSVINGAARGLYRFSPVALNLVGEVAIKVVVGLSLVSTGVGVAGVMAAFAIGAGISLLHSLWIIKPSNLLAGKGWYERSVISSTTPLFVGMLGVALMINLDVLGLKIFSPASQGDTLAGYYQAAVILARTPVFIAQALTLVIFSYVAGIKNPLETKNSPIGESQEVFNYLLSAFKSWYRLLLPAGLALILAPHAALSLFFPQQYQAAISALRISAAGGILLALVTLLNGVLQAAGERKKTAIAAAIATVIQLITLVLLVPRLGAIGSALSLLAAGITALIGLISAFKPFSLPLADFWTRNKVHLYRLAIPFIVMAAPLLLLPEGSRVESLVKFGLAGAFYAAALFSLSTLNQLRQNKYHDTRRPLMVSMLSQFVRVLLGG